MFESVLVANRGEIAVRVIRTLRRLGIRSVAVFSDADAGAVHVAEADVAVRLGPAPARESYLHIGRILDAACSTGAEAVHPGYGFLAENAAFARACAAAGVVFVGPSPEAMEVMGDKIRAKQAVSRAGVPVVPGRIEPGMTDADLVEAAAEVGYPVLVKPSAGGGGKGMHLVADPDDLPDALRRARREAAASFGDDTLFLERFVTRPRHIEVQVLADDAGTTVHLGERECSLQRRHQKIVEEAPSALLDEVTRQRIGASACATARSVAYTGAGTVEFIVGADRPDEYFFMEMNTRLQVEHPVTEMVTGLDLVEAQVRIAAGQPLGFDQADVALTGHAVEARVYAEDPARGFLPTGGRALVVREPSGEGIRVDSGLAPGLDVGATYDPMLAKVIAWGPDRPSALARLEAALARTAVLGFATNVAFLRALLRHPDVRAGRLDTGLVERALDSLVTRQPPPMAYAAYALVRLLDAWPAGPVVDPWDIPSGWRPAGPRPLTFTLTAPDGETLTVAVRGSPTAAWVRVGAGDEMPADIRRAPLPPEASIPSPDRRPPSYHDRTTLGTVAGTALGTVAGTALGTVAGTVLVTIAGTAQAVITATDGPTTWISVDGAAWPMTEAAPVRRGAHAGATDAEIRSPMPGTVITVNVADGDTVSSGRTVLVVEAMKMEHSLPAPHDGTVQVFVQAGDRVAVDQVVARVDALEPPSLPGTEAP